MIKFSCIIWCVHLILLRVLFGQQLSDFFGEIQFSNSTTADVYENLYEVGEGLTNPWSSVLLYRSSDFQFIYWEATEFIRAGDTLKWVWKADTVPEGFSILDIEETQELFEYASGQHKSIWGNDIVRIVTPQISGGSSIMILPPVNLNASQGTESGFIRVTWTNPNDSFPAGTSRKIYAGLTPEKESAALFDSIVWVEPQIGMSGVTTWLFKGPAWEPYLYAPR